MGFFMCVYVCECVCVKGGGGGCGGNVCATTSMYLSNVRKGLLNFCHLFFFQVWYNSKKKPTILKSYHTQQTDMTSCRALVKC